MGEGMWGLEYERVGRKSGLSGDQRGRGGVGLAGRPRKEADLLAASWRLEVARGKGQDSPPG